VFVVKKCNKCGRELPLTEFYKSNTSKSGFRGTCKDCDKATNKEQYWKHHERNLERVSRYNKEHREERTAYARKRRRSNVDRVREVKRNYGRVKRSELDSLKTPCVKCGETRPHVIDFHHIDPSQKQFTIVQKYRSVSESDLNSEIAKCVCLCANCHREFHYLYGVKPKNPIDELREYLGGKL